MKYATPSVEVLAISGADPVGASATTAATTAPAAPNHGMDGEED
jgi:hypothetical protein